MTREDWEYEGLEGYVLDPEYYDEAIVGITHDGRAIYDWDKIVELMAEHDNVSLIDAIEWHEYNTIRALPYYENAPIIGYFHGEKY